MSGGVAGRFDQEMGCALCGLFSRNAESLNAEDHLILEAGPHQSSFGAQRRAR
jgi:hypothetical protein